MTKHDPKRLREATTRSPAETQASRAWNTAAIPLANAHAASAPSMASARRSSTSIVGLLTRE